MKSILKYWIAAIGFCAMVSCEDMNSLHRQYLDRGELIYPGKVDSINIYPGIEKVKFEWEIKADPRIAKVEIRWSEGAEARKREYPVTRTEDGAFTMSALIEGMPEGSYSFEFITWDDVGNRSLSTTRAVDIYGATNYLAHRTAKATRLGNGTAIIWQPADPGMVRVELSYTDFNGVKQQLSVWPEETNTIIFHQNDVQMVTVYKQEYELDTLRATARNIPLSANLAQTIRKDAPCYINIVDFDLGGEGIAYHDTDAGNNGGNSYRSDLGDPDCRVDIEGNPPNIGWSNAGEWLQYTVKAEEEGDYLFDINLSVNSSSARYSLIVNGEKTAIYDLRNNSSWGDYRWYHQTNPDDPRPVIRLKQGFNILRVFLDAGGFNTRTISLVSTQYPSPDNRIAK